jgi:hypothetical protein
MYSKFSSTCATTGKRIQKGTLIYYDTVAKKAHLPNADLDKKYQDQNENDSVRSYVDAQESAYFDNFSRNL